MFVIYIFSTLILVSYLWLKWQWTYWTKKGVYQVEPVFPFGNQYGFITKTKHLNEHLKEDAEETKNLQENFYNAENKLHTLLPLWTNLSFENHHYQK